MTSADATDSPQWSAARTRVRTARQVEHYNKGGTKNPWLHQDVRELKLTDAQKKDLVEFLRALGGEGWQHIKAPTRFPQ